MAAFKKLKTLLFFTVILAISSLIAMFVYTGELSQKWKENLLSSEVLHAQNLSWIDALDLDLSGSGGFNDTSTHRSAKGFGLIHQLQKELSILNKSRPARKYGKLCSENSSSLVGPLHVEYKSVPKMADLEKEMSSDFNGWVSRGGSWMPTDCQARVKMALVIPFRNRHKHLSIFLSHMHPFLKKQNLHYRIIIVEQAGDNPFNRAILFNIGYEQALNFDNYDCFIFHDVDLLPEDDRNEYSCPTSPRHMSVAVDTHKYKLMYKTIFGGVGAFSREHFELINGFSNEFWGWGGEDDDLYTRISTMRLNLTRPSMMLGSYKMIKQFHSSGKRNADRYDLLDTSDKRMVYDGLNTLNYTVKNLTEHRLYTLVTVYVNKAVINGEHVSVFSTLSVVFFHLLASL